ncbi:hypothetical protein NRB_26530 [Novosphingobium sp. 11B]
MMIFHGRAAAEGEALPKKHTRARIAELESLLAQTQGTLRTAALLLGCAELNCLSEEDKRNLRPVADECAGLSGAIQYTIESDVVAGEGARR